MEEEAPSSSSALQLPKVRTLGFPGPPQPERVQTYISLMMFLSASSRMASLSILPAEAERDPNPAHVSSSITLYCHLQAKPGAGTRTKAISSKGNLLSEGFKVRFLSCVLFFFLLHLYTFLIFSPFSSLMSTIHLCSGYGALGDIRSSESDSLWLNSCVEATMHKVSNFCSNQFPDFLAKTHYQAVLIFSTITVKHSGQY